MSIHSASREVQTVPRFAVYVAFGAKRVENQAIVARGRVQKKKARVGLYLRHGGSRELGINVAGTCCARRRGQAVS